MSSPSVRFADSHFGSEGLGEGGVGSRARGRSSVRRSQTWEEVHQVRIGDRIVVWRVGADEVEAVGGCWGDGAARGDFREAGAAADGSGGRGSTKLGRPSPTFPGSRRSRRDSGLTSQKSQTMGRAKRANVWRD